MSRRFGQALGSIALLLLTAAGTRAQEPGPPAAPPGRTAADLLGPRITLEGPLTAEQALTAYARQAGLVLQVLHLSQESKTRTADLSLTGAMPEAARLDLARAYGVNVWRLGRGNLAADDRPAAAERAAGSLVSGLGQPLDQVGHGWSAWLTAVRSLWSSNLLSLDGSWSSSGRMVNPRVVIACPSGQEAARIIGCEWVAADGTPQDPPNVQTNSAEPGDPLSWVFNQGLPGELVDDADQRLAFLLHYTDAEEHRFAFDLGDSGPASQADALVDARLERQADNRWLVTLSGDQIWESPLAMRRFISRYESLTVVLRAADGTPMAHQRSARAGDLSQAGWSLSLTVVATDGRRDRPAPASLELSLVLPSGPSRQQLVVFDNLDLPRLDAE